MMVDHHQKQSALAAGHDSSYQNQNSRKLNTHTHTGNGGQDTYTQCVYGLPAGSMAGLAT
jgi:hypothetical protein